MWELLPRKAQLTVVFVAAIIAVGVWNSILVVFGHEQLTLWGKISFAVFAVGVVLATFAELGWRWVWGKVSWLQSKLFPDLNGVWSGSINSTWIDPETDAAVPAIPTEVIIRQGLFSTSVFLKTGESSSNSEHVFLERVSGAGRHRIWYSYTNGPKAVYRDRSQPHDGVAFLEVYFARDPDLLEGSYYTSRKTTGDISVRRISASHISRADLPASCPK